MKRKITIFILFLFLALPVSSFGIPLAAALLYSLGAHAAVIVGGIAYTLGIYKNNDKQTKAKNTAIGRPVDVVWVDLNPSVSDSPSDSPKPPPKVKVDKKTAKVKYEDLRDKIKDDSSGVNPDFPTLQSKLYKKQFPENDPFEGPVSPKVGSWFIKDGYKYKISWVEGLTAIAPGSSDYYPGQQIASNTYLFFRPYAPAAIAVEKFFLDPNSKIPLIPSIQPLPDAQIPSAFGPDGVVDIRSTEELDEFIKKYPGSVSIVDGDPDDVDNSSPSTLPAPVKQSVIDAAQASSASINAASKAIDAAGAAKDKAQENYDSNPSAENGQKLADAQAAYDKLQAEYAKEYSKNASDKLSDEEQKEALTGAGSGFSATPYGDSTDFNFVNRFSTFFNQMRSTAFFSLPGQYLSSIPNSSDTVISFDAGNYGQHNFDFSSFSSAWSTLRAIIQVIFGLISFRIVMFRS